MAFEKEPSRTNFLLSEFRLKIANLRMETLRGKPLSFGKQLFTQHSRLFHYTTIAGLFGIINTNSLWLTNTLYMNDISEQKHSLNLIKETFLSLSLNAKYSSSFKSMLAASSTEYSNIASLYSRPAYVACFTDNGDSLPMWCMYSNISAVSIEFELNPDYNFVFLPNCCFEDILYDDDILKSTVIMIVDEYYNEYK